MSENADNASKGIRNWLNVLVLLAFISFVTLLFVHLYWSPPISLSESSIKELEELYLNSKMYKPQYEFLLKQYEIGTSEIEQNLDAINNMFYKKFILIGGLIAALFFKFLWEIWRVTKKSNDSIYRFYSSDTNKKSGEVLTQEAIIDIFSNSTMCIILALALLVCMAIDLQINEKTKGSKERGTWIKYSIEKPVFKNMYANGSDTIKYDSLHKLGWENFFRDNRRNDDAKYLQYFFSKFSSRYFLTYFIYACFMLSVLLNFYKNRNSFNNGFVLAPLIVVHIGVIIVVYLLHCLPGNLVYTKDMIPFVSEKEGYSIHVQAFLLSIVLFIINLAGLSLAHWKLERKARKMVK